MQQIKINNNQECAVIDIEGTIGVPEQWQFEDPQQRVATYEGFRHSLAAIEELQSPRVGVNIRSTGGDVGDALLIYDALEAVDAEITTRCWGYVASAATVIAQAASEGLREISPNALYLIHSSTSAAEGNATELAARAELLRKSDERLAELYARRSGGEAAHFAELMSEEAGEGRWLSAAEAIEQGLADKLIESTPLSQKVSETLQNAISSVKGLFNKIGLQPNQEAVLNEQTPEPTIAQASTIEFDERQRELTPTTIQPIEDPSLSEPMRSANENAYQRDARRFRN